MGLKNRDVWLNILHKLHDFKLVIDNALQMAQVLTREIPVILEQPEDFTGALGDTAIFHVEAANVASCQWQYKKPNSQWGDYNISGTDSVTMSITISTTRLTYEFRAKITGIDGSIIYSNPCRMILEEE